MSVKQALAQKAVSWSAVALGTLPGFYGLVMLCQNWVPEDHVRPDWLVLWLQAAGLGILGLIFIIASLVALRNRRRAGLSFLLSGPVVVFCLSFEDSFFGVPFRGYNWNRPSLPMAALFVCAFFAPLYAPLVVSRNRKRAVCLFLGLALLSVLLFCLSPWSAVILPRQLEFSVVFLVFGAFWLGTGLLGWPALAAARRRSVPRRLAAVSIGCATVAILVVWGTLLVSAMNSQPWDPDCEGRQLFARPLNAEHAAFTARAIRVGHVTRVSGRWAGNWAIGLVQERFWGLPWWSPRLVFLTTHAFWEGETYLVDGNRDPRLLNRFLPIVEAGPCTHTRPVADGGIELRLLREAPSSSAVRIAGRVENHLHPRQLPHLVAPPVPDWNGMSEAAAEALRERQGYWVVGYRRTEIPLPGARIRVTGSSGSVIVTSDGDGFYELTGLPADTYKLELLDVPDTQYAVNHTVEQKEMLENSVVWANLYLFWNGAIKGKIRGLSGGPAKLWLSMERADGTVTSDDPGNSWTDDHGAFSFGLLPPGRYTLRINPDGPRDDSPYAPQYYPFSPDPQGAHVFEVAEGQRIGNADFVLRRLYERILRVRVAWPSGRPADEAEVHIGYEHTDQYDQGGWYSTGADHNGFADVTVFSGSHIRAWAKQLVNEGRRLPAVRYSAGVEVKTDELPARLDLVLISTEAPFR